MAPAWHGAEYPRAPCARRAALRGGRLRAPLCAGFADGALNTNACPPGSSKIVPESACRSAAGVLGRTYYGIGLGSGTYADSPSGCYSFGGFEVHFNAHPTGRPTIYTKPLCAGKPAA